MRNTRTIQKRGIGFSEKPSSPRQRTSAKEKASTSMHGSFPPDVTLRTWKKTDKNPLVRHANNKKIWDNVRDFFPHPYTLRDAELWLSLNTGAVPANNLVIEVNGRVAGGISVILKQDVHRLNAEIGYWLGENYWNKGIMTEALKQMVQYVFQNFPVYRIYASVFEKNRASMKVLKKAGFRLEAILQSAIIKNGEMMDEYIFSLLRI